MAALRSNLACELSISVMQDSEIWGKTTLTHLQICANNKHQLALFVAVREGIELLPLDGNGLIVRVALFFRAAAVLVLLFGALLFLLFLCLCPAGHQTLQIPFFRDAAAEPYTTDDNAAEGADEGADKPVKRDCYALAHGRHGRRVGS